MFVLCTELIDQRRPIAVISSVSNMTEALGKIRGEKIWEDDECTSVKIPLEVAKEVLSPENYFLCELYDYLVYEIPNI